MKRNENRFITTVAKKLRCIEYKGSHCVSCNIDLVDKPWLAHFHHRQGDAKHYGIMAIIGNSLSLFDIRDELDKCDLLCCGCHAEKHFQMELFVEYKKEILQKAKAINFESYWIQPEQVKEIERLALVGKSITEIAIRLDLSLPTVRKYVPATTILGNDKIRKITDAQLKAKIEQGHSLKSIALEHGMGYKTVWKRAKKLSTGRSPLI